MRVFVIFEHRQGIIGVRSATTKTGHFYDFGTALFRYSSESDRTKGGSPECAHVLRVWRALP